MSLFLCRPNVFVAGLTALLSASGCTQLIHNDVATKDIFRYKNAAVPAYQTAVPAHYVAGRGMARSEVIKQFGAPVVTWTFHPSISVGQAYARHIIPADNAYYNLAEVEDSARIGRIDEFRIHGPIYDGNKFAWEDDFLRATLGLGDLLLFPFNLWDYVSDQWRVTPVRVFYRPDETYLYQAYSPNITPPQLKESP